MRLPLKFVRAVLTHAAASDRTVIVVKWPGNDQRHRRWRPGFKLQCLPPPKLGKHGRVTVTTSTRSLEYFRVTTRTVTVGPVNISRTVPDGGGSLCAPRLSGTHACPLTPPLSRYPVNISRTVPEAPRADANLRRLLRCRSRLAQIMIKP